MQVTFGAYIPPWAAEQHGFGAAGIASPSHAAGFGFDQCWPNMPAHSWQFLTDFGGRKKPGISLITTSNQHSSVLESGRTMTRAHMDYSCGGRLEAMRPWGEGYGGWQSLLSAIGRIVEVETAKEALPGEAELLLRIAG